MSSNNTAASRKNMEDTLSRLQSHRVAYYVTFALLLAVYFGVSVFVQQTARSDGVLSIMGQPTPLRSFTGMFSNIANTALIFLVIFHGRPGFVVALVLMVLQFPVLFLQIFVQHEFTTISGLFTNLFAVISIVLIYLNNQRMKKVQTKLRDQAITDTLTGIPNRYACTELLGELIRQKQKLAIATMNLNNFKSINSTMGIETGNKVLIEIASLLNHAAEQKGSGTEDLIACMGGDEFAVIVRNFKSEADILQTIRYYNEAIEKKLTIDGCDYFLTASTGYAEYPGDAADVSMLMAHANAAVQAAKRRPAGEQVVRYTSELMDEERSLEIERRIRAALDSNSLFCYLQPQYDVTHKLIGFEALARMQDTDGSFISPADFIPVAEKVGLIDRIDKTVFRQAAGFFGELIRKTGTDVTLSINVSVKHLMKNDFLEEVRDILDTSGVPANQLEIEITESILIDSVEKALQVIGEIKKMGIKIAIDDFGTGYSSLSYLNAFPADMLKIDKVFIDKITSSDSSKQYVAAIVTMGHVMNFKVISEGVEQPEQLETLRDIGCDYIQGFIWGKPMPLPEAEELTSRLMN